MDRSVVTVQTLQDNLQFSSIQVGLLEHSLVAAHSPHRSLLSRHNGGGVSMRESDSISSPFSPLSSASPSFSEIWHIPHDSLQLLLIQTGLLRHSLDAAHPGHRLSLSKHVGAFGSPWQTLHESAQLARIHVGLLLHSPFDAHEGHSELESVQAAGATVGADASGSLEKLTSGVGLSVGGDIPHWSQDLAQLADI